MLLTALVFLFSGVVYWAGAWYRWGSKKPDWDPLRGLYCVPGFVLVLIALTLVAFWLHWTVGLLYLFFIVYAGYYLVLGK